MTPPDPRATDGRRAAGLGKADSAFGHFGIALRSVRRSGDHRMLADIRESQGFAEFVAGRLDSAAEYFQNAANLHRRHGFQPGLASTHAFLGHVALARGDLITAAQHYRRSLQASNQPDHSVALAFEGLAAIEAQRGETERAEYIREIIQEAPPS